MKRGDIFSVVLTGDYGKPRPAIIVQSNSLGDNVESVIVCPLTSFDGQTSNFRFAMEPSVTNGLRAPSQVMGEKLITIMRRRVGHKIGELNDIDIKKLDAILMLVMGLSG